MKGWVKVALIVTLLVAAGVAVVLAGVYWYFFAKGGDGYWSTESPTVRAELDAGFKDFNRGYGPDAVLHFERALELDPKNAAALAFLAMMHRQFPAEHQEYRERLLALNLEAATDFERFLADLVRASGQLAAFQTRVDAFLVDHPDEPFARDLQCNLHWDNQRWEQAESCYRDLLAAHPDWVVAQQRLGDLAMAQGRFAEAEEHYVTFRYVAPDQAAPYYQLGQLYLFLGRFEDSEAAQKKALELKADYCQAYTGLVHLYIFWNRLDDARKAIDALDQLPTCGFHRSAGISCTRRSYLTYLEGDLAGGYAQFGACQRATKWSLIGHHMAVATGDAQTALTLEGELGNDLARTPENKFLSGYLHHNRGVRLLAERDFPKACEELETAEQEIGFWPGESAFIVLMNKVYLITCLEQAGQQAEAEKARAEWTKINSRLLETFHLPEYSNAAPAAR